MDQSYLGAAGLAAIALVGFALALLAFVDPVFSQSEHLSVCRRSTKLLTRFIRDCHAFIKQKQNETMEASAIGRMENQFRSRYEEIVEESPDSTLGRIGFLEHKRIHRMTIQISQMISEDPFSNEIDVKMAELKKIVDAAGLK